MPWPGHCCQWFDRTGCLHSRLPRERCEACLSASQTMTNLWHCHRIPKEGKDMKISFGLGVLCHFQRHQCCFYHELLYHWFVERTAPPPPPPSSSSSSPSSSSPPSSSSSHCLNQHNLFYHLLEDHPTSITGKQSIFISELHKTVISMEISKKWGSPSHHRSLSQSGNFEFEHVKIIPLSITA